MNPDPFFPAVYEDLKVNMLDTKFIPFPKLPFSSLSIETHNFQDRSSMLTLHCSPPRSSHAKLIALFFIYSCSCMYIHNRSTIYNQNSSDNNGSYYWLSIP